VGAGKDFLLAALERRRRRGRTPYSLVRGKGVLLLAGDAQFNLVCNESWLRSYLTFDLTFG